MRPRIYIDTSVIGGCEDDEFSCWSVRLFDEFRKGLKIAVISDLTRRELEKAPEKVKMTLESLPEAGLENVFLGDEAEALARKYVEEGVVAKRHWAEPMSVSRCAGADEKESVIRFQPSGSRMEHLTLSAHCSILIASAH